VLTLSSFGERNEEEFSPPLLSPKFHEKTALERAVIFLLFL
jgi:hypothetical protein